MVSLRFWAAAVGALLATAVSAQDDGSDTKVWATFAYIYHGEKTPDLGNLTKVITPQGAQQMWKQGDAFRQRYLLNETSVNTTFVFGNSAIEDIQRNAILNDELSILSTSDQWDVASAIAFMQGLYPPANQTYGTAAGGADLGSDYVDDDTVIEFPLGGYQYPSVESLSVLDSSSVALQGNVNCNKWNDEMTYNFTSRDDMETIANSSLPFYQDLFLTSPLEGTISLNEATFWNAGVIYDFVTYMYTHNETVNSGLKNATDIISQLLSYATTLEQAMNSPVNNNGDSDKKNKIYTIAGRTLAEYIRDKIVDNMDDSGILSKMTLMFGSYRPMLAFASLAGLVDDRDESNPFKVLPQPGAALVFEMVGENPSYDDQRPYFDDMQIRFYYRASTEDSEPFTNYALFHSGFDGASMPYTAFLDFMHDIGSDASEWCEICNSTTTSWCAAYLPDEDSDDSSSCSSSGAMNPAVAGLIGAIIMGAVIALAMGLLFAFCGFRLRRKPSAAKEHTARLGGFKGAEKMASDTDLTVGKAGSRQERIGSWELRGEGGETERDVSPHGQAGGAGIVVEVSREGDDDQISIAGATPVQPSERV